MSYYVAGFGMKTLSIKDIENSFIDVVPPEIQMDILSIRERDSFLQTYGSSKVINDVIIHSKITGSWLAILGTPLIHLTSEDEKAKLLDRFFIDPIRAVKEEFDGCFAVVAHNASADTFYAITDYDNTTPIFYAKTTNGIYFSSHELPLARFLQSEIDPLGFSMTIHFRLTWGQYTRFKDIHKLLPCQILTFRSTDKRFSELYWNPSEETQWPSNFDDVLEKWRSLLNESVKGYYSCSKNKTVISDFTAGEDARLLLSQCHALGIPFFAMVNGLDSDIDVMVAREAARVTGFNLVVQERRFITRKQLLDNAIYISLMNDGYEDYFTACTLYATNAAYPPKHYDYVKLCGAPGGEVFRGSYYLRGKALFPSSRGNFDYRFFTRMKYMLDFFPGLLRYPDEEFKKIILALVEESLKEVTEFPVGIKIDHLLRVFQTCNDGLIFKNPRYLPFATKSMTRSIYNIPPRFKRGGRLTKACTELLYPELAFVKTQKGVPTVRRTLSRTFLFMPEYFSAAKAITSGVISRLLKWADSNKPSYRWAENVLAIDTLINKPPYGDWLRSSKSMITGYLYNDGVIDALLADAKAGSSRYVPTLGRVINQELACRWVYRNL